MSKKCLIVFVKAPRPGTVKTRLGLGPDAECAVYQRLVHTLLDQLTPFHDVELRFTPSDARREIAPWLGEGWSLSPQGDGDLGDRLKKAFRDAFAAGIKRVVIIGSDCPYIRAEDIQTAWAKLETHDLVLGPAEDGGYWLIGLREPQPAVFNGIEWSSSTVLSETLSRAKALGLKISLLRTLSDVDTRQDWERFISAAAPNRTPPQSPAAD